MRLERLDDADIAAYVSARFRETGRSVGESLNPLLVSAQGHPQRTMLLAHRLWEQVEPKGTASLADWGAAHAAALEELRPEFDANWRRLTTNEQKALRAVVAGSGSPYRRQMLEQLDVAKSSVSCGAVAAPRAGATVEQRDEEYALVDPLFAEWVGGLRETGEAARA